MNDELCKKALHPKEEKKDQYKKESRTCIYPVHENHLRNFEKIMIKNTNILI